MRIVLGQALKSTVGVTVGILPGLLCWWQLDYSAGWAVFIATMGAFIGLAITLPGVSAKRVLGATAGLIVAKNTSHGWGEKAYETIAGNDDQIRKLPAQAPSMRGGWWWAAGLAGLLLTLLGAFSGIQEGHKNAQDQLPKPPSEEMLKKLSEEISKQIKKRSLETGESKRVSEAD